MQQHPSRASQHGTGQRAEHHLLVSGTRSDWAPAMVFKGIAALPWLVLCRTWLQSCDFLAGWRLWLPCCHSFESMRRPWVLEAARFES
jgi:hypothetical protein